MIEKIVGAINSVLEKARAPHIPIPGILMLCSVFRRPGMSEMSAASRAIHGVSEFGGYNNANLPDGSPNKMNALIYIIIREVFKELRENGVVEVVATPSSIISKGVGIGSTGTVDVTTFNTSPVRFTGHIR